MSGALAVALAGGHDVGSTGNLPVPFGSLPNGTEKNVKTAGNARIFWRHSHFVRQVAGQDGPVARSTADRMGARIVSTIEGELLLKFIKEEAGTNSQFNDKRDAQ